MGFLIYKISEWNHVLTFRKIELKQYEDNENSVLTINYKREKVISNTSFNSLSILTIMLKKYSCKMYQSIERFYSLQNSEKNQVMTSSPKQNTSYSWDHCSSSHIITDFFFS